MKITIKMVQIGDIEPHKIGEAEFFTKRWLIITTILNYVLFVLFTFSNIVLTYANGRQSYLRSPEGE